MPADEVAAHDAGATDRSEPAPPADWRLTFLFMLFGLMLFLVTIGLINAHA